MIRCILKEIAYVIELRPRMVSNVQACARALAQASIKTFCEGAEIKGLSLGGKDLRVSFLDKPATAPQQNSSKQARASIHPHATSRSPSKRAMSHSIFVTASILAQCTFVMIDMGHSLSTLGTSGSCRVACCRPPPEQAAVAPAPTSRSQREIPSHKLPRIANAMHKKMLAPPGGFSHNIFG
eukprot:TRINITY_DN12562_c0_g1_i7.p1 TRINITY_DN12562_c0_g1~~TRINITY_DN12562_c0_g1_i7.p1  ORF type:complete len:182 (+),score=8.48 TRINITY_DN12562_c0_g1_i7:323-868(+)